MRLKLAAVLIAAGLGAGLTPSPAHAVGTPILAVPGSFAAGFVPNAIVAQANGTVVFVNLDIQPHDVTHNCKGAPGCTTLFKTATIGTAGTAMIEWLGTVTPGATYDFFCTIHPNMQGQMVIAA